MEEGEKTIYDRVREKKEQRAARTLRLKRDLLAGQISLK